MLARNSGFTAVAVLTLGLGIGANSTIFSWISATLLDPVPGITSTSDLVTLMRGERSEHPTPPFSYLDYLDVRANNQSFSDLLAYYDDFMSLTGTGKPDRISGALTSANYFDVLGVRPILGRGFLPAEEQSSEGASVVVISEAMWRTRLNADGSVIGRTLQINRHPFTIVGIAPPGFQGCRTGLRTDVWIPLGVERLVLGSDRSQDRGNDWLNVLGRLRPRTDQRQAAAEFNLLMERIVVQHPDSHRGPNEITLDPLWRSPFGANVYLYTTLPLLMGIAGVLLLLACANLANLLLVRSVARRREIAIRISMGASRWRLVRQLLIESVLLALGGGCIAMLITTWTAGTFGDFIPPTRIPITLNGRADHSVLLVTLGISILTAMIFGILPALRTTSLSPAGVLKEEAGSVSSGYRRSPLSSGLVIAQIALSLVLLICAGLFVRSLRNAQRFDPGFDPNHVLLASYELGAAGYSRANGIAFHRQLLAKVAALPGVESVTLGDFVPLSFSIHTTTINPEGYVAQPHESMQVSRGNVGPNYLRTMRTPLVAGRDFSEQDTENSERVAIVNQALADRYWPRQDAIGKRLQKKTGGWYTVVGVAGNGKYRRVVYAPEPVVYLPLFQDYHENATLHVRVSGDPQAFASAVENAVHELNADLPVFNVTTLKSSIQFGSIFERIAGTFVGAFGLLALVLGAVGIYGVVAYTTRQRTHEIGIRMALGARRRDVFRLVMGQGLRLTLLGLSIGLAVSLAVTRVLRNELFGVTATDPLTYASVAGLLCIVALLASYIPARRAAKVDPMVALRYE
jgi:predicted permease